MTGQPGDHTMEMNEALRRTLCAPLVPCLTLALWKPSGFRLHGATWDHFHCTVEPLPGHIWRQLKVAKGG